MNYEVTIGIPVYNVEKYIRLTMDSALAQTFPNIEFLILDDCGTDKSIDIVREYQQTHPRGRDIRIVSQPYNKGIGEARNRIVDEARGRFLYFMDADDTIAPHTIELLYSAAQKHDAELVYGSYERIETYGDEEKRIAYQYAPMVFVDKYEFAMWVYQKYSNLQAMVWNVLIAVDIYCKNNLRHLPISYWEDFVFTIDLPVYVHRAVMLPDITYFYYCREGSASKYQKRKYIEKREIESTIGGMRFLKSNSLGMIGKPFFSQRMSKVLMTCYFVAKHIVMNEGKIDPPFTSKEIRNVMRTPLTIFPFLRPSRCMIRNLFFYLLGEFPPSLTVWLIKKEYIITELTKRL